MAGYLPLLDANIVQNDENSFGMIQPDGWRASFGRDASNPNILHGSGGWTAEIQGDLINVYSSCGSGWKMVFTQGKITSLSKDGHEITIRRDTQGKVSQVADGAKVVMALERDEKTGLAKSIEMGSQKYEFGYDDKPQIQNVNGANLVTGVVPSLNKITYPQEMGGKSEGFDFAVTDKLLPNLKIINTQGQEKMIVWDLAGHILQDGEWNYTITPAQPGENYAAIGRKNQSNQSEYWHHDDAKGEEVTQGLDGTKTVKTWFTSGILVGKTKKIETNKGSTMHWRYNENAKLIAVGEKEITVRNKKSIIAFNENGTQKWKIDIYENKK